MNDSLKLVVPSGVEEVRYDIAQAQEDEYAKYEIQGQTRSVELELGDSITTKIVNHILDRYDFPVTGFIVDEAFLSSFETRYGDEYEIYNGGQMHER